MKLEQIHEAPVDEDDDFNPGKKPKPKSRTVEGLKASLQRRLAVNPRSPEAAMIRDAIRFLDNGVEATQVTSQLAKNIADAKAGPKQREKSTGVYFTIPGDNENAKSHQ